jgi:hypothetical protein
VKKLVIILLFIFIMPVLPGMAAETEKSLLDSIAIVTNFEGNAMVKPLGRAEWQFAEIGMPVYEGDEFRTGQGSFIEITFDNASIIRLDDNSNMKLSEMKRDKTIAKTMFDLMVGRIMAIADKLIDRESNFQVRTRLAVAAVKGTKFIVESGGDKSSIGVFDGAVRVVNSGAGNGKNWLESTAGDLTGSLPGSMDNTVKPGEEFGVNNNMNGTEKPAGMQDMLKWKGKIDGLNDELERLKQAREQGKLKDLLDGRAKGKSDGERLKGKLKNELLKNLASELRYSAHDLKFAAGEKLNDNIQGKTMMDMHGNRVRVEEYVLRPQANKIDFLSLTERSSRTDFVRDENIFNRDIGPNPQRDIWNTRWYDIVETRTYRTDEKITYSNCIDKVVQEFQFAYYDGSYWLQTGDALVKNEDALWVNGLLKEHRIFSGFDSVNNQNFGYFTVSGPGDMLAYEDITAGGLLTAQVVKHFTDNSTLTLQYHFINDFGKVLNYPGTTVEWMDLFNNSSIEMNLLGSDFQNGDIDIVSKNLWFTLFDPNPDRQLYSTYTVP